MIFYSRQNAEKLLQRNRFHTLVAVCVGSLTLLACIVCCCLSTTATVPQMERLVIGISIIGGWIVIFELTARILPGRRMAQHELRILEQQPEQLTGRIEVLTRRVRIPKTLSVKQVRLYSGPFDRLLSIREECVNDLPNGQECTVQVADGYIIGVEEAT